MAGTRNARDQQGGEAFRLGGNAFGRLVRAYRADRGWSQEELARRWGFTRAYVSQIEHGKRRLNDAEQVGRLADILEIPLERLEAIGQGVARAAQPPQSIGEADDYLLQALLEPAQTTVKLSWLVWHANHDATMVENLTLLVHRLEDAVADRRGRLLRPAQQLLGYAHEMLGKIAFDRLDFGGANGHFQEMFELGEELADADLTALSMLHQGDVLRRRGRLEHAVGCLDAAAKHAAGGTVYTRGLRQVLLARTHAEQGQKASFLRAIEQAQAEIADARHTVETTGNELGEIAVLQERAQGHTLLGEPAVALDLYRESERLQPFRPMRDLGVLLILKAQAHAYAGDVEQGVAYALQGLRLARGYASKRHISRVQRMYDRLAVTPLGASPRLRDLREALRA